VYSNSIISTFLNIPFPLLYFLLHFDSSGIQHSLILLGRWKLSQNDNDNLNLWQGLNLVFFLNAYNFNRSFIPLA
jgi:hypothetical protein